MNAYEFHFQAPNDKKQFALEFIYYDVAGNQFREQIELDSVCVLPVAQRICWRL